MSLPSSTRVVLFSRTARRRWALTMLLLTLVILVLALAPPVVELPSSGWDKSDHVAAFAALALCGDLAWRGRSGYRPRLGACLLLLGVFIEAAQALVPGRRSDWRDVAADAAGIVVGMLLAAALTAAFDRRRLPRADEPGR